MKIFDRYSLLCISIAAILLMAALINEKGPGPQPPEEDIVGIAYDIKTTKNGYTFSFEDSAGGSTRCFARTEPSEFGIYSIRGSMSDDGGMFFVDSMRAIHQNELYRN